MRDMWKRMAIGVAALLAVGGSVGVAHALCGDINSNGSVTTADATQLLRATAGLPVPGACGGAGILACGDMNADGSITPGDYVIMQRFLAGLPTLFPICTGQGNAIAAGTTISGNISTNQVWTNAAEVCCSATPPTIFINGTVFVNSGVTITIKPGTVVKGIKGAATPSVLVFKTGAKINAPGRPDCPIIFTSNQAVGSRGIGDWGGVVLNGNAPVNCAGGVCSAEGLTGVLFGGTQPNDSSGVMRYCRIEYSGVELSLDNELNVFTQNGVGASTNIDHIQTNVGFDDGFEWFGGTVSEKFLLSSAAGDDNFDWQLGTTGAFQYGLAVQNQSTLQAGNGNNGFEGDNNENGLDLLPRSTPKFCNFTLQGTVGQGGATGGFGALLRRGTGGHIQNTMLKSWFSGGIDIRDDSTMAQGCTGGANVGGLTFNDGILCGNTVAVNNRTFTAPLCNTNTWYNNSTGNNPATAAAAQPACPIAGGYPTSVLDVDTNFVPAVGSIADGTGASCVGLDPIFDATTYVGAFDPHSPTTWLDNTSCWISFALN